MLAITVGANTSLFAVMNAVLLRPLPGVRNPAELVRFRRVQNGEYTNLSYPDYVDYRDRNRSFTGVVAERDIQGERGRVHRFMGVAKPGSGSV